MIFNKDILFLHVGKTGGSSARTYLRTILKRPIYTVISNDDKKHYTFYRKLKSRIKGEHLIFNNPHSSLKEAIAIIGQYGLKINLFKKIICVVRNPYDLELSLYYHLRKESVRESILSHQRNEGLIRMKSAEGTFEEFVSARIYHRLNMKFEDYIMLENSIPPNVEIIRFEEISEKFEEIANIYGGGNSFKFPHLNKSERELNIEDIKLSTREIIEDKYRWIFENHYYPYLR